MTDDVSSYANDLRRLRRMIDAALAHDELPEPLRPENIEPAAEDVERAAALRSHLMSGDVESLRRETACASAPSGFNRGSQEPPAEVTPELDEARERVRKKRRARPDTDAR